jgi:hypothetical protein
MLNRIIGNSKPATPVVGMGATRCGHSDRHAYSIVEIKSPRCIIVQRDKATRTDKNGQSESQSYTYEADPEGEKVTLTLRIDGRWREKGEGKGSAGWLIGERMEYYDYSF